MRWRSNPPLAPICRRNRVEADATARAAMKKKPLMDVLKWLALLWPYFAAGHATSSTEADLVRPTKVIDRVGEIRRQLIAEDERSRFDRGEPARHAQWYNWPNYWANWPNWPNWGNWGNWRNF